MLQGAHCFIYENVSAYAHFFTVYLIEWHLHHMIIADCSQHLTYDTLRQSRHEQSRCSVLIQHTTPTELALEMARKHGHIVNAYVFGRDADRGEMKVHSNSFATHVLSDPDFQTFE
jgi:hypothetical protein